MKQPSIKIYGKTHKVKNIEFNSEGLINRITYYINEQQNGIVFRNSLILDTSLNRNVTIQEPTPHPWHSYSHAPDLESLLVTEETGKDGTK